MVELAWTDPRVVGIMSPGSCPEIVEALHETHWYLPCSAPGATASRYYRHLVPDGMRLPSFVSGRQTIVPALHFAWWLLKGKGAIHLWGSDFGCSAAPASLSDYYAGTYAPGGAELHLADEWFEVPGQGWTNADLLGVSRCVDALTAFLRDGGVQVYQHRRPGCGVRLTFAEVVEAPVCECAAPC